MSALGAGQALQGALHAGPPPPPAEPALLLGAGGWLGSALLAQLLQSGHGRVGTWVERAMGSTHRGVIGQDWAQISQPDGPWQGSCAYLVLERGGLTGQRDAVFGVPRPEDLLARAQALRAAGVRRLVLVLPHLPGSLPEALHHGFADQGEQALSGLGFEQLLLVRSSREALGSPPGRGWLERLMALWWAQLSWMLPANEKPLRSVMLARVVVAAARLLRKEPGSLFILTQRQASAAAHEPLGLEAGLRRHWLGQPAPDASTAPG